MGITTHNWGVRPIVTLVSEYWESDVQWHAQPNEESFQADFGNYLRIQAEFKYKKPYGGDARYWFMIEKPVGQNWRIIHAEEIVFWVEPRDDDWHTEYREFDMYWAFPSLLMYLRRDWPFNFRITVQIQGPGNLPTGGGGSSGYWSDPESRDFTAIFKSPQPRRMKARLKEMERYFIDSLAYYRNREP